MMRWIIKTSLRFRFVVVAGAVALMVFGVGALRQMPVDVFPEFAPPRVQIQTACLGPHRGRGREPRHHADGAGVRRHRRARHRPVEVGAAAVVPRADLQGGHRHDARPPGRAGAHGDGAEHPARPGPRRRSCMQPLSATSRVMKIGLSSDTISLEDLSMTAYWKIRARLLRVPGVANIPMWGERIKAYEVEAEPQKLADAGVTLDALMEVTSQALDAGLLKFAEGGFIGTGGFIDTPNQRLGVRHAAADRHRRGSGPGRGGRSATAGSLKIGDVAKVVQETPNLAGDAVINDGPGLMLVVEKLPWGNTVEVTKGIEKAIDDMRPGLPGHHDRHHHLPAGHVRRAGDRPPHRVADPRRAARGARARAVPLRLALGADQRDHDAAVVGRGRARPLRPGRHHQHDGVGRSRHRPRRDRRRRHRRRREHRPPAARSPARRAARSRPRRSSSTRRSRFGARSSTPRSSR